MLKINYYYFNIQSSNPALVWFFAKKSFIYAFFPNGIFSNTFF